MNIPVDRYIKVGDVNTRYWAEGEGYPVLLLHGITGSVESWLLNYSGLAQHFRVYAIDYVGHGKTDKPPHASYHVKDLADFSADFLHTIGVQQAHVIGHSLGGFIGWYLVLDYPEQVNKLVSVAGSGLRKDVGFSVRAMSVYLLGNILGKLLLGLDIKSYIKLQRLILGLPDSETVPDELFRHQYPAVKWKYTGRTVSKTFRSILTINGFKSRDISPVINRLDSIQHPILTVWGSQDTLVPSAHAQILEEKCPHAQIKVFEGCGHCLMMEQPQKFNHLVIDFLTTE